MKVVVAGQTLADFTTPMSAQGLDGRCLVQQTDIVRAVQKALRYRGNETVAFNFTITLQFASLAAAEVTMLTWWSALPKQGVATFYCGWGDADPNLAIAYAANCVIEQMRVLDPIGCTMRFAFYLLFGAAYTGAAPGIIPPTPGLTVQLISVTLASGATTWSFTYPTPFTTACAPSVSMICPGGSDAISCVITSSTLTGCSGTLSGPTPTTGYAISGNVAGN